MSSRPSTSRASDRMMAVRGSFASEMVLPAPMPSDFFQRRNASSSSSEMKVLV